MNIIQKSSFEEELAQQGRLIYTNVGDSMLPLLREGRDLMIIEKPEGRLRRYDVAFYKRDSGQYVLHRVLKVRQRDYVICGDHRYCRETGIGDRNVLGVLTGVVRDGKTLSVKAPLYRFYGHLWCDFFYIRAAILFIKRLPKRLKGLSRRRKAAWRKREDQK